MVAGVAMLPMEIEPEEVKRRLDAGERLRLVDVREPFEYHQAHIAKTELIHMRSVPQEIESLRSTPEPLVVFCHHGVRSLQVVEWLRSQGLEDCMSMSGGIDQWSLAIDPAVPRY
jgi:rhodanese-related sulfurtransferase